VVPGRGPQPAPTCARQRSAGHGDFRPFSRRWDVLPQTGPEERQAL